MLVIATGQVRVALTLRHRWIGRGLLVMMLHVLHQRFRSEEEFMADEAARRVGTAYQSCVLLKHSQV